MICTGGVHMNAINLENVTKTYGSFKAVDNISFSVKRGQFIGFLGVNGAGKSTTINMMSTLLEPASGKIEICGFDTKKDGKHIREKIGVVYQNNVLDDPLTVKENLICRGIIHGADRSSVEKDLSKLCEIFLSRDILNKRYSTLSGGQKRKCEIAAALIHTPEILILDEPTTGLDPASRREVWEAIEELQRKTELTVFLTTHYMEEAAKADKIIILNKGHIIACGLPHELKAAYAFDRLKIYCGSSQKSEIMRKFADKDCTEESYGVSIKLRSAKEALAILSSIDAGFDSFEVIHGTLDDVFLEITKEDN